MVIYFREIGSFQEGIPTHLYRMIRIIAAPPWRQIYLHTNNDVGRHEVLPIAHPP